MGHTTYLPIPKITNSTCLNCASSIGFGPPSRRSGSNVKVTHIQRELPSTSTNLCRGQRYPPTTAFVSTLLDALVYLFKLDLQHPSLSKCNLKDLVLCSACGELVTKLYLLHKDLDALTDDVSFLGVVLKNMSMDEGVAKFQQDVKIEVDDDEYLEESHTTSSTCNDDVQNDNEGEGPTGVYEDVPMDWGDGYSPEDVVEYVEIPSNSSSSQQHEQKPRRVKSTSSPQNHTKPNAKTNRSGVKRKTDEDDDDDPLEENLVPCPICGEEKFSSKLSRHIRAHKEKEDYHRKKGESVESCLSRYECSICGDIYQTAYHVKNHMGKHFEKEEDVNDERFICLQCGKVYLNKDIFQEHQSSHTQQVDVASKSFSAEVICLSCRGVGGNSSRDSEFEGQQLQLPCFVHKPTKKYYCEICGKDENGSDSLSFHVLSHLGTEERLKARDNKQVVGENLIACPICGVEKFVSKLRRHVRAHKEKVEYHKRKGESVEHCLDRYECSICGITYRTAIHAKNHIGKHFEKDEKVHNDRFICLHCGKVYLSEDIFKGHQDEHEQQNDVLPKPFTPETCKSCRGVGGNSSVDSEFEGQQLQLPCLIHKPNKKFFCEICGRKEKSTASFNLHVLTHLAKDKRQELDATVEKSYLCTTCGASFAHERTLYLHDYKRHGKMAKISEAQRKYNFQCALCSRSFKHEKSFNQHMELHDTNTIDKTGKPVKEEDEDLNKYSCEGCLQVFSRHVELYNHKPFCDGLKHLLPYPCKTCGRNFGGKKNLRSHLVAVHKLERSEANCEAFEYKTVKIPKRPDGSSVLCNGNKRKKNNL